MRSDSYRPPGEVELSTFQPNDDAELFEGLVEVELGDDRSLNCRPRKSSYHASTTGHKARILVLLLSGLALLIYFINRENIAETAVKPQDNAYHNASKVDSPNLLDPETNDDEPTEPDPVIDNKEEPTEPDPVIDNKEEPKEPDPVIDNKEEPTEPDPVIDNKEEPKEGDTTEPDPVIDDKEEPKEPDPVIDNKEVPKEGDTTEPNPVIEEPKEGEITESDPVIDDKEEPKEGETTEPDPVIDEKEESIDTEALIEKWGKWHFWDGDPESRPTEDYLAAFPNNDCPADDFPMTAWQGDGVYVNHFLDSGSELVSRAKEAIYTEYGWGPKNDMTRDQLIKRRDMFKTDKLDVATERSGSMAGGGWTTKASFHGLVKRLLHAMMTNDSFTVVMGGHSAAAGHGNHFLQSYMMQFHKIMEPVFKRLGMNLITRNIANGGMGTMQNALGSKSLYGDNVDIMVWDSSMTENDDPSFDLFCRQALIGGKRAPVLWSSGKFNVLKDLHLNADADIMEFGTGLAGVPITESREQVDTLPWAARYLSCPEENRDLCDEKEHRFRTTCWVDRDDVSPLKKQADNAGSQVKWHPGFRAHQLRGRVLAFTVLNALQDAIDTWSEKTIASGHPLMDEYWHITDHYDNIQKKAKNLDPSVGACTSLKKFLPERVCTTGLQGRSEFTPRANPKETSITSIMKPTPDGYIPKLEVEMLYDGPDVANPSLMVPGGEVDVRAIVSNRRNLLASGGDMHGMQISSEKNSRKIQNDEILPGKGWEVTGSEPGNCDGTATGICGRRPTSKCLLYGHMDGRGGLLGNGLSGWLVMNLSNITEGLIILKMETWHTPIESTLTKDWTEPNNGDYRRNLAEVPNTDMIVEYAIDGQVTTLTSAEFNERKKLPQRVVEVLTILDNPDIVKSGESKDMEVGFRLRNCGRNCNFRMTHVYWA